MNDGKWVVSMIGSRQYYAPARALHIRGLLERFYTDFWCTYGRSLVKRAPGGIRRMAGRYHPDLPSEKVTSFGIAGLANIVSGKYHRRAGNERRYDYLCREGRCFAMRVAKHIRSRNICTNSPACVVSTFRLKSGQPSEELFVQRVRRVVNHELGHTFGLLHCDQAGCLMRDAMGSIKTVDDGTGEFCIRCTRHIRQALGRRG